MKAGLILCLFTALTCAARGAAEPPPAPSQAIAPRAHEPAAPSPSSAAPSHFELSPAQRAKAVAYAQAMDAVYFGGVALSLLIYLLFWQARFGVALRRLAERISHRLAVQCLIVTPLLLAGGTAIAWPLDFYAGFVLERRFGLSSESFGVWMRDWGESFFVTLIVAVFVTWVFYAIVRRSPKRWWFHFWLAMLPAALFVMLVEPWVIEPMFYKFHPLDQTHPELTAKIEALLRHADLHIPRSRILEMKASSKTREIDAYVSGFGPSKRLVIWDTALASLTTNELLLVVGHEVGHYVLHHVLKEFALIELVTLCYFFVGFWMFRFLIRRWGKRTGVKGESDLASLPLALLVLILLTFLSDPVVNAISRHYEHQADQFALEVTYGVVRNPNADEARAFQVLGERDLSAPDPSAFIRFWLYSHPPINARIHFAATYKPWAEGKPMEFVHPRPAPK